MAGVAALVAAGLIVPAAASYRGTVHVDVQVWSWASHLPRWIALTAVSGAGLACFLVVGAATFSLGRHDRRYVTTGLLGAAGGVVMYAGFLAGWRASVGAERPRAHTGAFAALVVDALFLSFAIGSEIIRRGRWRRRCAVVVTLLFVISVFERNARLIPLLLAVCGACCAGFGIRYLLGASSIRADPVTLKAWLASRGLAVGHLQPVGGPGSDLLAGTLADGTGFEVRLADGDSRLSGAVGRAWSLLRFRTQLTGRVALSSRVRLRELALTCCLAEKAGVRAPVLLLLEPVEDRTMALVTRTPEGAPVAPPVKQETADALFVALRDLHRAGVAHRRLQTGSLLADDVSAGFSSLDASVPAATELSRRIDVAQLLTTVAGVSDPDTALQAMRTGYADMDEAAVAAVLQPLALAPWGWSSMRSAAKCLDVLRGRLIGAGSPVAAVQLERFRWRTVISVAAMVLAAYVLVGQLSSVNLVVALQRMSLWWFAVAVAASAVTYLAAASTIQAFVPRRLPLGRTALAQLAAGFVGVAMPSTLGYVATNARYLTRQRVDQPAVAAAITLSQIANAAVTVVLVGVLALLTGSGLSQAKLVPGADLVLGVASAAGLAALLAALPQTRVRLARIVVPHLKNLVPRLAEAVSRPARLAMSVVFSLLLNAGYVVAFVASLVALGAHPPLLPTAIVFLLGNFVGSAAPTPGGLGGVEAALVAGLATIGVPADQAIPAVVVFRFATFWLPIPLGWLAYVGLQRDGSL